MTTRKTFLLLALCLAAGLSSQAQAKDKEKSDTQEAAGLRKELKELALTDEELGGLEAVTAKDEAEIAKAQAEIKVLQARLERLMLEKKPPMDEIKGLLKESLEWEYRIRVVRIERNLAIRALLGEERWARVYRVSKAWIQAKRGGKAVEAQDPRSARALKILEALQ